MKKHAVLSLCIILIFSTQIYSQEISNIYRSESLKSGLVKNLNLNLGVRSFSAYNNTESFINANYLVNNKILVGAEINFQETFLDTDEMSFFLVGKYRLNENLSAGSFVNISTGRYGLLCAYDLRAYDIFFDLTGGLDFSVKDLFVTLSGSKFLSENWSLYSEITYSEGDIQSPFVRYISLVSGGVSYKINDILSVYTAVGYNLSRDHDPYLSFSFNYIVL